MVPLSPETRRRLDALFAGRARETAAQLLITQCAANLPLWVNTDELGLERIRFAVLKLSGGDLVELERAVQIAQVDWRDALVAAGFGQDVKAHESWFPQIQRAVHSGGGVLESITGEYTRYKALAEAALDQLTEGQLVAPAPGGGNSIATICWHVGGNLRSRFSDFLTSDGEKPWRNREDEFLPRAVTQAELMVHWEAGWSTLFTTLAALTDADLSRTVTTRGQPLRVDEALHRSLAHTCYHVGQVIYAARALRGSAWRFLSIPPGQSEGFNAAPVSERGADHAAALRRKGGA